MCSLKVTVNRSHLNSQEVKHLLSLWLKLQQSANKARLVVMKTYPFDPSTEDGYPENPDTDAVVYFLGIMAICIEDWDDGSEPKIKRAIEEVTVSSSAGPVKFNGKEAVWLGLGGARFGEWNEKLRFPKTFLNFCLTVSSRGALHPSNGLMFCASYR